MTDRVHSLTVVLDQDIREDDVQGLVDAIRHLRHVVNVGLNVTSLSDFTAKSRADQEWRDRLFALMKQS